METIIFFLSFFLRDVSNVFISILLLQILLHDKLKKLYNFKTILYGSLLFLYSFGWAYACYKEYDVVWGFVYYAIATVFPLLLVKKNKKSASALLLALYLVVQSVISDVGRLLWNIKNLERTLQGHYYINVSEIAVNAAAICFLLFRLKRKKEFYSFRTVKPMTFILLIFTIYAVMLSHSFHLTRLGEYQYDILGHKISYLTLVILLLALLLHLLKINFSSAYYKEISKILTEQIDMQISHYQIFKEKEEQLVRFQHDYINMTLGLQSVLKTGDIEQVIEYMNDMGDAFSFPEKLFDTGNPIADALLLMKSRKAMENNINIVFDGLVPATQITNLHLCIILTNVLDNAMEACTFIDGKKEISIDSKVRTGIWLLSVKNPVSKKVDIVNNRVQTTKMDGEAHGFGIRNVQEVVEEYEGHINMSCDEKYFTSEIDLNLKSKD